MDWEIYTKKDSLKKNHVKDVLKMSVIRTPMARFVIGSRLGAAVPGGVKSCQIIQNKPQIIHCEYGCLSFLA